MAPNPGPFRSKVDEFVPRTQHVNLRINQSLWRFPFGVQTHAAGTMTLGLDWLPLQARRPLQAMHVSSPEFRSGHLPYPETEFEAREHIAILQVAVPRGRVVS